MDFYISKEEVVKSLNATLGVVEKRQTLPILSNVLFEVDESSLKLTATDLESEISAIMNDKSHPYHVKGHPDHDKSVQQMLTLREMLDAK